jgi:hypothetical protein
LPGSKDCQCDRYPDSPCTNNMTQEDFLCNMCRPVCRLIAAGLDIDVKLCCGKPEHMVGCTLLDFNGETMHAKEVLQMEIKIKPPAPVEPPKSDYDDAIRYMQNYIESRVRFPWGLPSGDIHYDQ